LRSGPQEIDDPADGRGQIDQIGFADLVAVEALFDRVDDSAFDGQARRTRSAASGDPPREPGPAQGERERSADQTATDDTDVLELAHNVLSTADAIRRS